MRFAWSRERIENYVSQVQPFVHPASLARFLYNLVFWVFLLPLFTPISYEMGFVSFAVIIAFRLTANLYANNLMEQTPQAFDRMPLRIPL